MSTNPMADERFEQTLRAFLESEVDRATAAAPPVEVALDGLDTLLPRRAGVAAPSSRRPLRVAWLLVALMLLLTALVTSYVAGWLPIVRSEPRNGLIAYVGADDDIYLAAPDGSERHRLTQTDEWEYSLAWSPDGRRLAFARSLPVDMPPDAPCDPPLDLRGCIPNRLEIVIHDLRGGSESVVASFTFDGRRYDDWLGAGGDLAWSAEGDALIYRTGSDGGRYIDLDDQSVTRWLGGILSPDGQKVLVSSGLGLFVTQVNPDDPTRWRSYLPSGMLRLNSSADDCSGCLAAWSPDSSMVAFMSQRDYWRAPGIERRSPSGTLETVHADGTARSTVADNVTHFAWSSDGELIAYVVGDPSTEEPRLDLWIAEAQGTGRQKVAEGVSSVGGWSPDGRLVYFARGQDVFAVRPDGTGLHELAAGVGQIDHYSMWDDYRPDVSVAWQAVWE